MGWARRRCGRAWAWTWRESSVMDAGLTVAEAAAQLDVLPKDVLEHLRRIRRDRRLPSGRQMKPYVDAQVGRDHINRLVALAQAGEPWPTVKETAATIGASEAAVYNWRRRARERLAQLAGEVEGA